MKYIASVGIIIFGFVFSILFYEASNSSKNDTLFRMEAEGRAICSKLAKEEGFKSHDMTLSKMSRSRPVDTTCNLSNGNIIDGVASSKDVDISDLVNRKVDKSGEILRSKPRV